MDWFSRVRSLEEQTRELAATYDALRHRIRRLAGETANLVQLQTDIEALRRIVEERERELHELKNRLPRIARKEEIERFSRRIAAMPFEEFAHSDSSFKPSSDRKNPLVEGTL
jgi:predicted RNase H-like nuclease (RuvC/YqgF family)